MQNKLLAGLDPTLDISQTAEVRKTIQELFEQILSEENIVLSRPERARLFEQSLQNPGVWPHPGIARIGRYHRSHGQRPKTSLLSAKVVCPRPDHIRR